MVKSYVNLYIVTFIIIVDLTYHGHCCGTQKKIHNLFKIHKRIVGGTASLGYDYPWFAHLQYKDTDINSCAGSLINPNYVVTAAHCFSRYTDLELENIFNVVLGNYNPCQADEITKRVFNIEKVHIHNKYKTNGTFFDIALLKLNGDASLFTPICLPTALGVTKPRAAQILGYGAIKEGINVEPCSMQTAIISLYTKSECKASNNPSYFWGPGILCAGIKTGYIDSCQGDSGGPLQVLVNGKYVLIGIVSFGFGCGRPDMPGVYTDVSKYLNWMSTKINNDTNTEISLQRIYKSDNDIYD